MSLLQTDGGTSFTILAHEVASQIDVHKEWGGVVPMLAKREHMNNLPLMLEKINPENVDLIAVTYGPGLEPALWTGILFAKDLAKRWGVPLVPTDHMAGHIYSSLLKSDEPNIYYLAPITYPGIALLISGGHTELVLMKSPSEFEVIGNTRDDAVGECFDKCARMMGLPYPGGPEIGKLASKWDVAKHSQFGITLPRPMIHSKDLDFSFSGLKTAVLYLIRERTDGNKRELSEDEKIAISYELEQAITEVLVKKVGDAVDKYEARSLLVGGGVIASKSIRDGLTSAFGDKIELHLPDKRFVTDNATMIGIAGYLRSRNESNILQPDSPNLEALCAKGNLSIYK